MTGAQAALARIVRGAHTSASEFAPQAARKLAVSRGLSARFAGDATVLGWRRLVLDAPYVACRDALAAAARAPATVGA